jgi:tetratricopeptide (TPR) repeat protein
MRRGFASEDSYRPAAAASWASSGPPYALRTMAHNPLSLGAVHAHDSTSIPMKRTLATPRWVAQAGLVLILAGLGGAAMAQPDEAGCFVFKATGRLEPEDYRKPSARLKVVEDYHFASHVEALIRPMQAGMPIGSDLDYTLWGYPNHHRALVTLVRLGAREKTDKPRGANFSIDCYFRRALRIASDDLIVRMLYANYLGTVNRKPDALRHLTYVVDNAGDNPLTHYNAGLIYLEFGAFEQAATQARKARDLGYPRPDLQQELQRRGQWRDEPAAGAAPAPASAASR